MADEGDFSADQEILHNELWISKHTKRHREEPEYDADGAKICIDCDTLIPKARAELDFVVRCIHCQAEEEDRERRNY